MEQCLRISQVEGAHAACHAEQNIPPQSRVVPPGRPAIVCDVSARPVRVAEGVTNILGMCANEVLLSSPPILSVSHSDKESHSKIGLAACPPLRRSALYTSPPRPYWRAVYRLVASITGALTDEHSAILPDIPATSAVLRLLRSASQRDLVSVQRQPSSPLAFCLDLPDHLAPELRCYYPGLPLHPQVSWTIEPAGHTGRPGADGAGLGVLFVFANTSTSPPL